jgi:hypothetical protein
LLSAPKRATPASSKVWANSETTKMKNEKNSYNFHSPLRRDHPGAGLEWRCHLNPTAKSFVWIRSAHQTRACCSAYPGPPPSIFLLYPSRGGARARPWVSRRGAGSELPICILPPKYPNLPDLVLNDNLFQVQHRFDYWELRISHTNWPF